MKGQIFDIRRFSTHDGDGIRTTVFLKGCPLSCVWCQNPEGISMKRRPLYFENRCIQCGTCVIESKKNGMYRTKEGIAMHKEAGEDWDHLIYECPAGAIEWDSHEMEVEDVMQEIRKDQVFFEQGGGVTLSGGEPFVQWEFTKELLQACKKENIHTAIESSFFAKEEAVDALLPHLDFIFADMKLFLEELHKKYTGVSNERILSNIRKLLTSEKKDQVVIRTPMIPGITTTKENIQAIAAFLSEQYEDVTYELLNYNPLAEAKYHLVDRTYCYEENPPMYSKEEMKVFADWAIEAGIKEEKCIY